MTALDKQFLFVVGAPRSGTTWLHRMLAQHPDVASLNAELTLFSSYLAPVVARFSDEARHRDSGEWEQGLPVLFTPDEFQFGMRELTGLTYSRVLAGNPEATHILDKHPAYALHMPLIGRILPSSRFVHIIRDGREVAVSMMSARKRLGFGAGEIKGACRDWATHVRTASGDGAALGPSRYLEVRYEELMARTGTLLQRVFDFAGLPITGSEAARIAHGHAIENNPVGRGNTALDGLRRTPDAIWRAKLSLVERWTMDRIAGDLLQELGYAQPGWWAVHKGDRARMAGYPFLGRLRATLGSAKHTWKYPLVGRSGT
jgi:hypothetical protein